MSKINAVVRGSRTNSKGVCKVELAVSHKQRTAYIDLDITVSCECKGGKMIPNFVNGVCTKREDKYLSKNADILQQLQVYQERLKKIPNKGLLTATQIKHLLIAGEDAVMSGGPVTVVSASEQYEKELRKDDRVGAANNVRNMRDRWLSFMGDLPLVSLSPGVINEWRKWMRKQPAQSWHGKKHGFKNKKCLLSESTINKYISYLKSVVNRFVRCGAVKYEVFPFESIRIPHSEPKICDLDVESINKVLHAHTHSKVEEFAQDMFAISFYMGGMNIQDIARNKWNAKYITFARKKIELRSRKKFTLPILPQVQVVVNKYVENKKGFLQFPYDGKNLSNRANYGLKKIAEREGIFVPDGNVCMMSARKSFAQFAGLIGAQRYVVDYCMGHCPSNEISDHYQRAMAMQAEAVCKAVADFVEHPEKWQPIMEYRAMLGMQLNI